MAGYDFTQHWFSAGARAIWDQMLPLIDPSRVVEIGSYEGASACYLVEQLAGRHALELHCIDHWQGGREHEGTDMLAIEARFHHNLRRVLAQAEYPVALHVHKSASDMALAALLHDGKREYFDFVYIDGSHQATDVISDAVLGFKLLRPGGVMAFDDYLWHDGTAEGHDPRRRPKPAIDAFVNIHLGVLDILPTPNLQMFVRKRVS